MVGQFEPHERGWTWTRSAIWTKSGVKDKPRGKPHAWQGVWVSRQKEEECKEEEECEEEEEECEVEEEEEASVTRTETIDESKGIANLDLVICAEHIMKVVQHDSIQVCAQVRICTLENLCCGHLASFSGKISQHRAHTT